MPINYFSITEEYTYSKSYKSEETSDEQEDADIEDNKNKLFSLQWINIEEDAYPAAKGQKSDGKYAKQNLLEFHDLAFMDVFK